MDGTTNLTTMVDWQCCECGARATHTVQDHRLLDVVPWEPDGKPILDRLGRPVRIRQTVPEGPPRGGCDAHPQDAWLLWQDKREPYLTDVTIDAFDW